MSKKEIELLESGISCILSPVPRMEREEKTRMSSSESSSPVSGGGMAGAYGRGRPRKGQSTGWEDKRSFATSVVFDEEQYERICNLARKKGITIKLMMYQLLEAGLENCK